MSAEISTPKTIWIVTEETSEISTNHQTSITRGARGGDDIGGRIGGETIREPEPIGNTKRQEVDVAQLKQKMQGFLQAMKEMLEEVDEAVNTKIQLDEVELSVEINGEGQVSLLGVGGTKVGGKGGMTFKFKRK